MGKTKHIMLLVAALLMVIPEAFAQNRTTVRGVVSGASDGLPLIGAVVYLKGDNTVASVTERDGSYALTVPTNGTLVFTLLGYDNLEVEVASRSQIDVTLQEATMVLNEAVVSALGIQRQARSLTYSTQQVTSEDLTRARDINLMNALAGKAAGVTISHTTAGLGGASKVSIRGFRSASGNNQPLYVINGVPMKNSLGSQLVGIQTGSHDGGDGLANLNPDDIESISILKGASASALYGTEAANGVVMITTKKGQAGRTSVTINSNTTFDNVAYLPQFQSRYGEDNAFFSWGPAINGLNKQKRVQEFFSTGVTATNTISLATGNNTNQTYVSYGNTTATGIYQNSRLSKHNFNVRNVSRLWKAVTIDANFQFIRQDVENRPRPGGSYSSPLTGIYLAAADRDLTQYKEHFEVFDASRNLMSQNWYKPLTGAEQNPWWIMNRNSRTHDRNRFIGSLSAKYDITPWLNIQARGSIDFNSDIEEVKFYATTSPVITNSPNGLYEYTKSSASLIYTDVLLNLNKRWGDFALVASIGGSFQDNNSDSIYSGSYNGNGLSFANVFTVSNIVNQNASQSRYRSQKAGVFATANLGFRDYLYLDLTARNDWSSALAYTKSFGSGFFYPSVGLTFLISEAFKMPQWINYAKIRGSYANVGNDIPARITNPTGWVNYTGTVTPNTTAPFGDLKPEISSSLEFGTEWHFFNDRLTLDFTWYKTNTQNQLFSLPAPAGSGYTYYYVNAGNIQNMGTEIILGITPVMTNDFIWKTQFNMSQNKNTVISLHDELPKFTISDSANDAYRMYLEKGGSYGDFYGYDFDRDENGKIKYDDNGLPIKNGKFVKIGNATPDFLLGWNNTFDYKGFSLGFLVDCRFGGQALSMTQADLDLYGVSEVTAKARDAGYVMLEGTKITDVEGFYKRVGNRDGVTGYYVYDATNIRLRELTFGYSIPSHILRNQNFFKNVTLAFVARNLCVFYCAAPYDTDATMSASSAAQGVDYYGVPATRSLGFNIKLGF